MLAAIKTWAADLLLDNGTLNLLKTSSVPVSSGEPTNNKDDAEGEELTFDLAKLLNIPEAKLQIQIDKSYDGTRSYKLSKPRLSLPDAATKSVQIKGIKVFRNDQYLADTTTFTSVDVTLSSPGGVLSSVGATIDYDKGPDGDQLSLGFDVIKVLDN